MVVSNKCKKYYVINAYQINYYEIEGKEIQGNKNYYKEELQKK